MAEGGASAPTADLTVVLFNCDSAKKKVGTGKVMNEPTRRKCVTQVLDKVRKEKDPSLFVLVQDNITGPLHKVLLKESGSPTDGNEAPYHNKEVGIYNFSQFETYNVERIDRAELTRTFDQMKLQVTYFSTSRTMSCVITQRNTAARVLLVSWHGPHNNITDQAKAECFHTLIDFVINLQRRNNCSAVMVGGDFNISEIVAHDSLSDRKDQLQAEVISDYKQPAHRKGFNKIDFVVYWPAQCYQVVEASVIEPEWSAEDGSHPFGHPIVMFRFKAIKPDTAAPDHPKEALQKDNEEQKEQTELFAKLTIQDKEMHHKEAKAKESAEMRMMMIQVLGRMEALKFQEMLKAKDEYIGTMEQQQGTRPVQTEEQRDLVRRVESLEGERQQISKEVRQLSDSLPSPPALTTGEVARAMLKEGRMPLLPPAKRDWSLEVVTLPDGTRWPPKGWQKMTPDEKLDQITAVATGLQKLDGQETGTGGQVVYTYGMLHLLDTGHDQRTRLTETQIELFQILKKVAVSAPESVSAEETDLVLSLSQLPRPTGVVAKVIDALKDIPLGVL
ncbi:hypothetical protein ACOMHN_048005 [Nucella lapillus]